MKIKDRPEYKSRLAPFALRPHDVVPTAVKTMSEKNIGSVVVVDDAMQVKGIVTERDLLRRLLNKSLDPNTTLADRKNNRRDGIPKSFFL